jgi:hypothetical protein
MLIKPIIGLIGALESKKDLEDGKMRERRIICIILVLAFVLFSGTIVKGGVVYTSLIDTSFFTTWYSISPSGHINFSNTLVGVQKVLNTYGDVYTLTMSSNSRVTFSPNLARDTSSGGVAKGYFDGGATVTITGGLKDSNGSWVYGGTGGNAKQIFQAIMVPLYEDSANPAINRWSLEEEIYEPGNFDKTLMLSMVDGSVGLASGITLPNGDILKMIGPKMDLSLKTDNVSDFSTNFSYTDVASSIKITGLVPEPMTLLLFGIGTLCLRKKC